ncbi:cytochrome P450, partial [Gautieria morchelliformis]
SIPAWLSHTALDVLGQAAFGYDFGAIDEKDNELANVYHNLIADSFYNRSDLSITFEALWGFIPLQLAIMLGRFPTKQLSRLKRYMTVARSFAKTIVNTQTQALSVVKEGGKDVMSTLIKANMSEDPKTKLTEEEVMAQLTTLMIVGHETSTNTLSWALYEFAKHPGFQSQIREEIRVTHAHAAQRGDREMSIADLNSMKYMIALMKETLRCHPIATLMNREAAKDHIIPLSMPQTTRTGEVITSVPVSKGQWVIISLAAYDRLVVLVSYPVHVPITLSQTQIGMGVSAVMSEFGGR